MLICDAGAGWILLSKYVRAMTNLGGSRTDLPAVTLQNIGMSFHRPSENPCLRHASATPPYILSHGMRHGHGRHEKNYLALTEDAGSVSVGYSDIRECCMSVVWEVGTLSYPLQHFE